MPVIAVAGNKGGAGKTTLTVNLAAMLSSRQTVMILDADPQQSSMQWREIADSQVNLAVSDASADLSSMAKAYRDSHEFVFIDCPPSVHAPQLPEALVLADLVLIPVQPSPLDIWATVHIEEAVDNARQVNPGLQALMVINQLEPRTKLSQIMHRAMAELSVPTADTTVRRRAIYRNSFLDGRTAADMGKTAQAAKDELADLIKEMEQYL